MCVACMIYAPMLTGVCVQGAVPGGLPGDQHEQVLRGQHPPAAPIRLPEPAAPAGGGGRGGWGQCLRGTLHRYAGTGCSVHIYTYTCI